MLLSVIVPSLNTQDHLERMLSSLFRLGAPSLIEVIVVDMSSTDGTLDMLRDEFPSVIVVANTPNKGYGAAANAGIAQATGSHLLVCNSDLVFPSGSIERIMHVLDQCDQRTLLGFGLQGIDGCPQHSAHHLPGPFALAWMFAAPLRYCPPLNRRLLGYLDDGAMARKTQVGWVSGAALAASRSLFERSAGFDETFFMGSEEVDLCRRVWDQGGVVRYVPEVRLLHVGGGSCPDSDLSLLWLAQGIALYTRKHFGRMALGAARVGALVAYLLSFPVWLTRWAARRTSLRDTLAEIRRYSRAVWGTWRA